MGRSARPVQSYIRYLRCGLSIVLGCGTAEQAHDRNVNYVQIKQFGVLTSQVWIDHHMCAQGRTALSSRIYRD